MSPLTAEHRARTCVIVYAQCAQSPCEDKGEGGTYPAFHSSPVQSALPLLFRLAFQGPELPFFTYLRNLLNTKYYFLFKTLNLSLGNVYNKSHSSFILILLYPAQSLLA